MKKRFIYLGICFLVLCSCTPKKESTGSLKVIPINTDHKDQFVGYSTLFSKIEYIPLETSDECLIGEVSKIIYHKDHFYIADMIAKCVYVFDNKGKFISKIGSVGRGPGEYVDLANIFIDKPGNQLIIDADYKYQIYDLQTLRLIKEKKYIVSGCEKFYLGEECFGSYLDNQIYNESKNIVIEQKGDILDSYFPIKSSMKGFACMDGFFTFSENEAGDKFFSLPLSDTVYTISKGGVSPYCFVDFGNKRLPNNYMNHTPEEKKMSYLYGSPYFKCIFEFVDNKNYLHFIAMGDDHGFYNYVYLKNRKQEYLYNVYDVDTVGVTSIKPINMFYGDDFYIGTLDIDLACGAVAGIDRCTHDPEAIKHISNADQKKFKKIYKCQQYKILKQITDSLGEDANPILVKLYLKLE